jgi:ribosomal protein S1
MLDKQNSNGNSQNNFEEIINEYMQALSVGSTVKGYVVKMAGDYVLVNIGSKTEALIPKEDFIKEGTLSVSEGEQIEAVVTNISNALGQIKLSAKQLRSRRDFENIKNAFINNKFVNVKIDSLGKNGFYGHCGEVDAFVLKNHIDFKSRIKDENVYIGKTLLCKILKINDDNSFLASHRSYLEESEKQKKIDFFGKIKIGDIIKGKVRVIKDYGVFVDLGGVDGFLYKDNISWGKVRHPTQYLEIDDTIEVKVININKESDKVEVSLKHKTIDPWENVRNKYHRDGVLSGIIVSKKQNGYIVEIEEGIDGFIPDEEVSWFRKSENKLNRRDAVEGRVTGYDDKNRRLIMSVKLATENPWIKIKNRHPEGSIIKGIIKSIKDFGMFVDFGEPVDGLIRVSDISWTEHTLNLRDLYKEGETIEAKVSLVDTDHEKILLSVKQLESNPWDEIDKILPAGAVVEASVTAVDSKHIEVELPKKIKGIVTLKEIDVKKVTPGEKFKTGDIIKAVVLNSDINKKAIFLSIKQYLLDSERRDVGEYLKNLGEDEDKFSLGSILKDKLNKNN